MRRCSRERNTKAVGFCTIGPSKKSDDTFVHDGISVPKICKKTKTVELYIQLCRLLNRQRNTNSCLVERMGHSGHDPDAEGAIDRAIIHSTTQATIQVSDLQLREIETALELLAAGWDGTTCIDCKREISPTRRRGKPWAFQCVRCRGMAELARSQYCCEFNGVLVQIA